MSNAKSMIENVASIFNAAESIVQNMPDKSRIQLKELAQNVSGSTGVDLKDALSFVTFFARNTDLGYVSRGKNGGLIRGTKAAKPTVQTSKTASSSEDDDESVDDE